MPSSSPIENALASLLPTISFLPPDLISLAKSLLSQSRTKASTLKPEEEIGRPYACAHLACTRLEKRLDLEIERPKPPVKPKVYDKLYKYLDSALTTTGPRTPSQGSRFKDALGSGSGGRGEEGVVKTPTTSTRKRGRDEVTPTTSRKRAREQEEDKDVPDFVMPMIRAICKAANLPAAVPHIHVGAGAVVKEIVSRSQKQKDPPSRSKRRKTATPQSAKASDTESTTLAAARWPALVSTLFVLTAAKLRDLETSDDKIKDLRDTAIEAIKTFCAEKASTLPDDIHTRLPNLHGDSSFYLLEAEDCGWLDMDWYKNIPTGLIGEDEPEIPDSEEEDTPKEKRPHKTPLWRKEKHGGRVADRPEGYVGAAGLAPGLGTMFQAAVDWLSDERRAEYAVWKKGILKEIAAVEQKA